MELAGRDSGMDLLFRQYVKSACVPPPPKSEQIPYACQ